ncbi:hypothetical protein U2F10_18530 [Leptothoe sp. EHU-05/26/07-4]
MKTTTYGLYSRESLHRLEHYRPTHHWYWALKCKADTEAQSQPMTGVGWPSTLPSVDLKLFRE